MNAPQLVGRSRSATRPNKLRTIDLVVALMLMIAIVLTCMSGCATTGTPSINTQQGIAYEAVTFARSTSTTLLRAKKINLAQDQATQSKLSVIDAGIAAATTVEQIATLKAQADSIATQNGGTPK